MSTLLDITISKLKMTLPVGIRVVQTDDHTPVAAIARVQERRQERRRNPLAVQRHRYVSRRKQRFASRRDKKMPRA
jgi:hypothetical protein